jgi:hypothetical protein
VRRAVILAALAVLVGFLAVPAAATEATVADEPVVWGVGDLCDSLGACTKVADLIRADASTDAVALAGDLAYDNGSKADFARFDTLFGSRQFASGATLKSKSYPSPGNHEYRNHASACPHYFTYFGAAVGECRGVSWKSRLLPLGATTGTAGAWRVLSLNSNYAAEPTTSCNTWCKAGGPSTRYAWGLSVTQANAQRTWLADQCRSADNANQGAIVVFHHPALADGSYRPGTRLGRDLFSVAAANGCEIAIVGHDHLYERFSPRNASGAVSSTGLTQFLVGTGGHSPNSAAANNAVDQYVGAGALRLVLTSTGAEFQFKNTAGVIQDSGTVPLN